MLVQPSVYSDLPLRKPLQSNIALPGGLLLVALVASHAAQGAGPIPKQPISQQADYQIRSQSLDKALVDFSLKSGLQIIADGNLTSGVKSPGVSGRYTPEQALQKLLAGTGVTIQVNKNGTVTLKKATVVQPQTKEQTMPTVNVTGKADYDSASPYNKNYNRLNSSTATKTDTPIMETPMFQTNADAPLRGQSEGCVAKRQRRTMESGGRELIRKLYFAWFRCQFFHTPKRHTRTRFFS